MNSLPELINRLYTFTHLQLEGVSVKQLTDEDITK